MPPTNSIFGAAQFGLLIGVFVLSGQCVSGQELNSGGAVDFANQIEPIFRQHCYQCHAGDSREGGLRLTNRRDALADSDSGSPPIIAGQSDQSVLVHRITNSDDSLRMPPEGDQLSDAEIALVKQWINEGANWAESNEQKHWAYEVPVRPELNAAFFEQNDAANPIDFFVSRRLTQIGLTPSPPADPARMIRRASLALTGLPPSVNDVDAFMADPSEEAFEAFVDRCLQSPRYGERWAQPWLDLARYADSNGFQADQLRESWAYRDWVINAMNNDMPFDQFTIEQLAGDLLPDATLDQKIATGFHRTVTCNVEAGVHPEENRVNQVFDRVNTTGTVFLGTTIECCQCHNHKYDPFTQDEYYQLFAFFNNTPLEVKKESGVQWNFYGPAMDLHLPPNQRSELDSLKTDLAALEKEINALKKSSNKQLDQLKKKLQAAIETPVKWTSLTIEQFECTGGESFEILDDQSILVGGNLPSTTSYSISAESVIPKITAFRLDTLTHDSLPGSGPGRGDDVRNNFILSEFNVSSGTGATPDVFANIKLTTPISDFSQTKWPVANAIDGDLKTGWAIAPRFSQPHWATFVVAKPIERGSTATKYRFLIDQNYGRGRTIGRVKLSATGDDVTPHSIPENIQEILNSDAPSAKENKQLKEFLNQQDPERIRLDQQISELKKKIDAIQPPTTLVMTELDQPRETFKLIRGDYLAPGKQVQPNVPAILHPMDPELPRNRLGLAQWLVDPQNPLLARVAINRWWSNFFGHGLVRTEEDFGKQCEPPTHPELLDWLATELQSSHWSRKHIHKLIVMSKTFRQESRLNSQRLDLDPKNQFYSRGPRFRMPAEMIRDNGLAVSGLLSTRMGGPPVMPYQPEKIWRTVGRNAPKWKAEDDDNRDRRGVYVVWRRAAPYPSFVNFDAPDRAACVVNRARTNTPLQALTLLNDQAYLEMAVGLATKVGEELPTATPSEKIIAAMRRCVSRMPDDLEVESLLNLYQKEVSNFRANPDAASKFLKSIGVKTVDVDDLVEFAALTLVANVLLNLDETLNY